MPVVAMTAGISDAQDGKATRTTDDLAQAWMIWLQGTVLTKRTTSTAEHSPEYEVVAIQLSSSDAVLFTGASLQAWYGVPKVHDRSAPISRAVACMD